MFDLTDIGLITSHESIHHQRCHDIEEQLKSFDVKATVSIHTFNNTPYYVLEVDLNHKNSCMTVAKALEVTEDDVHFIHINLKGDYKIFWIEEFLINNKYMLTNGRLVFDTSVVNEDKALRLIKDSNIIVSDIWNNPEDIILRLYKKR